MFRNIAILVASLAAADVETNSVGMRIVRFEPGRFAMGSTAQRAKWDERPVHNVTITRPFYMSETEVTLEQFRRFRPGFRGTEACRPYVAGVSWYDATAFCQWLSEKEGKPYRLPTEAEWEYACRVGKSEAGALKNMLTGVCEWCLDWYGEYPMSDRRDPIGPAGGMARVVRGGGLDGGPGRMDPAYARATNRAGIAPAFGVDVAPAVPAPVEKPTPSTGPARAGLVGTWFGNADLTRPQGGDVLATARSDWTGTVRGNAWSAQWRGTVLAPHTGEVTFEAEADTSAAVQVAGKGKLAMVEGKRYGIVVTYTQRGGRSFLRLYWSWPGRKRALIPASALSHTAADEKRAVVRGPQAPSVFGQHHIGFRVVQAAMPTSKPSRYRPSLAQQGVKRSAENVKQGPPADRMYFRKRHLLPTPPENCPRAVIDAAGLHPALRGHNHSPALEVCPNGDVLMVIYTSYHEYEPEVSLMATRLRFGADQWDMPDILFDFPNANDHAPLLWNDRGVLHFFWGSPRLGSAFPFQWMSSPDSGATWGEVKFPHFVGRVGPHSRQPINTALRGRDGTMYVASDGAGGTSVLWAGKDGGKTWYDTGGRTAGRHTTCVLLKDGGILGMGGKNTDIDGFMPKAVSRDGGKTWLKSKTPFSRHGSNQRPSVLRLQSGRLLFACDFQCRGGAQPKGFTQRGALVALSDDEGETWRVKKLPGAQVHERDKPWGATLGYSALRQAPNGMIHLITTMNRPCLHFEMNEAWILAPPAKEKPDADLMRSAATSISAVKQYTEKHPNGQPRITWSAGIADDGRHLLHGTETWYYDSGLRQRQATYHLGRKVGRETCWSPDGRVRSAWQHGKPGERSLWTQWWPNGQKKAESSWRGLLCDGPATCWDPAGNVVSRKTFVAGRMK